MRGLAFLLEQSTIGNQMEPIQPAIRRPVSASSVATNAKETNMIFRICSEGVSDEEKPCEQAVFNDERDYWTIEVDSVDNLKTLAGDDLEMVVLDFRRSDDGVIDGTIYLVQDPSRLYSMAAHVQA